MHIVKIGRWFNYRQAVYAVLLEREESQPLIYIGSGTSALQGVRHRLIQYAGSGPFPRFIEAAIDNGYTISHKGLLIWSPIPLPAGVPRSRVAYIAMEATLTFLF